MFDVAIARDSPRPTVYTRPCGGRAPRGTVARYRPHDCELGRRERAALHQPPLELPDQPRTILDDEAVDRPIDHLPHAVASGHEVEHRERKRTVGKGIQLLLRRAAATEVKC